MSNDAKRAKSGRGLKWALALSLAVNLLILGFLGGAAWRFAGPGHENRRTVPEPIASGFLYVRALPREAQRELRRDLRRATGDLPDRKARRAAYERMLGLLRADTFDADGVRDILNLQAEAARGVQSAAQAGWLEIVSGMSVEQRSIVADRLERGLSRRKANGPERK